MRHASRFADIWRSRWIRVGLPLVCGLICAGVAALALYPWWATPFVRSMLSDRAQRHGASLEIEEIELDYGHAQLRGLAITRDDVTLRIDRIDVAFERAGVFSREVNVSGVETEGGTLDGPVSTLRRWYAERSSNAARDSGDAPKRRASVVPERLVVNNLHVRLTAEADDGPSVRGRLSIEGRPRERTAEIALEDVEGNVSASRTFAADRVHGRLDRDATGGLVFPLRVDIDGAATSITPTIAVADVSGSIAVADAQLSSVRVNLAGSFGDATVRQRAPGTKLWSLTGDVARDFTQGRIELEMESFALGRIPEVLARLPVVASEQATVGGKLAVDFAHGQADVKGSLAVAGLHVSHPMLAPGIVRDVGFEMEVDASIDPKARHVVLREAVLSRGEVSLRLSGDVVHTKEVEARRYQLRAVTPKVACQAVLEAIPVELVPSLEGFRLRGDFALDVQADIAFADLDAASLSGRVDLRRCGIRSVPARVSAQRLLGGFSHRVVMRDGSERLIRLYPGTPSYTPLSEISKNMVAAVLTTEDGSFWRHSGFLPSQFSEALRRNLKAGRIRLGASTITMQMVKNVLLSHERTFSRKLQEMFLTWYVEQTLSKERIMEIYLNVIEFGPGVYGVTQAASHYFGKLPRQLNSLEAAYLALLLPSPVRRHEHYCRGKLSRAFEIKLRRIHELMRSRGHIDELEYFLWKDASLHFDGTDRGIESACLREIDRLLEGTHAQRAMSGLLEGSGVPEDDGPPAWLEDPDFDELEDPAASDAPGTPAMDE